jgi:D-lyxose ketol-isomerase
MESMAAKHGFALPPFCAWTPEEWGSKGKEYDEIRDNMLGWDVTDYGLDDFAKAGLTLVTIRNGNYKNPKYDKTYAEKLILSNENQVCTMHFHFSKMEDIINRGGGTLVIELHNSTAEGEMDSSDVTVNSDGRTYVAPAGVKVRLRPGESITLRPGLYHAFWAEEGGGPVLIGEVSQTNDDNTDNRFYEEMRRFSNIEEDEEPYRLLCNEYPRQ